MKLVKSIEMADDNNIYEIIFGGKVEIKKDNEGGFDIYVNAVDADYARNREEAIETVTRLAIDDDLVVKGYGINSGKKYWQLSESLQSEIIRAANA